MQTDVDAIKPGTPIGSAVFAGYVSADFFIQALKKAGANPTPEKVQAAASKMTYQVKGLDRPDEVPRLARRPHAVVWRADVERRHGVLGGCALRVHHADVPGADQVPELNPGATDERDERRSGSGRAAVLVVASSVELARLEQLHRVAHVHHPEVAAAVGDGVVDRVPEECLGIRA